MQKNKSFVSAIIVAAGSGTRMNMEKNKMYVDVGGKPLLARTIQAFEDSNYIDEIILVTGSNDIVFCKQHIIDRYDLSKVKKIVAGGKERQNSVYNGLCEACNKTDVVLIHDGARPFINDEIIKSSIDAALSYRAAGVAVPVKDTIKISDEDAYVKDTPDRKYLWAIQTPQSFKYDIILNAHRNAIEDNYLGTDDAVLVERMGHKMKLIIGSYYNIKITTVEDLAFANAIAKNLDNGFK
jgi:2-C-methyl-D-erythritol 4-phosphate cytidylyltransferase